MGGILGPSKPEKSQAQRDAERRAVKKASARLPRQNPKKNGLPRKTRWLPFGGRRTWWRMGRQSTDIAGAKAESVECVDLNRLFKPRDF